MQPIRQRIVEIVKENGSATVAELAAALEMAQVSVRHHLDILIGEDLVEASGLRRRSCAGRPSQLYVLAPKAAGLFPQAHALLADGVLEEMKALLPAREVQGLFLRLAEKAASEAPRAYPGQPIEDRLDQVAEFLTSRGYTSHWQAGDGCYELYACNCPYAGVTEHHPEVCGMDAALIQDLLSVPVHRHSSQTEGARRCTYIIAVDPAAAGRAGPAARRALP